MPNQPTNLTLPRSPISQDDYRTLQQIVAQKTVYEDWLKRMEQSGAMPKEQIDTLRQQHNETMAKAQGLLSAFKDLHI